MRGELLPDDATGVHVHLTLDESSQYRIGFTSTEGEEFVEAAAVAADRRAGRGAGGHADEAGRVEGEAGLCSAVAGGRPCWSLEGDVTDDIGVAAIRLNLQVENGPTLPPQEYRSAESSSCRTAATR